MGLELVGIVLAVEDEFGVEVTDDWHTIRTVGDLHDVICAQLADNQRPVTTNCPSLRPFFVTRDAIIKQTGAGRRSVRPSTSLSSLLPPTDRRNVWQALQADTRTQLPSLIFPRPILALILTGTVAAFIAFHRVMVAYFGATSFPIAVTVGVCLMAASYVCARPFAVSFPRQCDTVSDVVRHVHRLQCRRDSYITGNIDQTVWQRLSEIISKELDIPVHSISRESRFIEDLKCG